MEPIFGRDAPGSPGAPLTSVSPNQQRYEFENSAGARFFDQEQRRLKDSSVLGKATLFEQMASQGKAHEKKTVESATLKRAEIAREEAEARCKQYKRELEEERLARRHDMQIIEEVKAMRNKISLKYEEAKVRSIAYSSMASLTGYLGRSCPEEREVFSHHRNERRGN